VFALWDSGAGGLFVTDEDENTSGLSFRVSPVQPNGIAATELIANRLNHGVRIDGQSQIVSQANNTGGTGNTSTFLLNNPGATVFSALDQSGANSLLWTTTAAGGTIHQFTSTKLEIASDNPVSSMARTSWSFDTGPMGALVANESMGTKFVQKASTIEKITLDVKESPTCSMTSTIKCYDCGTAVGACTSGQTSTLATVTVANGATRASSNVTVSTASVAAGEYISCLVTAGACTVYDAGIEIEARPQ
jgi:hypothetical protein